MQKHPFLKDLKREEMELETKFSATIISLQEIADYIESKEYNYLNGELLDFANDVKSKIENKINELKKNGKPNIATDFS